jgi:hypothetical protein
MKSKARSKVEYMFVVVKGKERVSENGMPGTEKESGPVIYAVL